MLTYSSLPLFLFGEVFIRFSGLNLITFENRGWEAFGIFKGVAGGLDGTAHAPGAAGISIAGALVIVGCSAVSILVNFGEENTVSSVAHNL